jgi:hypothetical protein
MFKPCFCSAFAATLIAVRCFGCAGPAFAGNAIAACSAALMHAGNNSVKPIAVISDRSKEDRTIEIDSVSIDDGDLFS